ncbi:hypothetical protein [Microcoleus vaginatus]
MTYSEVLDRPCSLKFICDRLRRQVAKIVMLSGSIADCMASFPT